MEKESNKKKIIGAVVGLFVLAVFAILMLSQGNSYEVTFDSAGGSKIATQKVKEGNKAKKPKDPTKDGYEFVLWENDGVRYDFNEKVTKDVKLKASWKEAIKKYKVTFEIDGKEETLELEKLDQDILGYLKYEDKEGYELRWYAGEEEYDFTKPLEGDLKLTGRYETTSSYTITFDTDGGNKIADQNVKVGGKAKEPTAPTKRGFIFDGWYFNNEKYDFDAVVKRSMKLVAHWKEDPNVKRYKVTFNSDGGSNVSVQTIIDGDKAVKPANPTKKGFAFVDWTLNDTVYNFAKPVTADIELKATWREVLPVKVTFDADGGTPVPTEQVIDEGSKAREPVNPAKADFTFVEWRLDGKKYDFNKPVTKDITLKAYWEKKLVVTFDADGGTPVPQVQKLDKGNKVSRPIVIPTKSGYLFAEWQLNGKAYNFNDPVTKDITLKAKWEKDKEKYTVKFDLNGGSGNFPNQTVIEGYTVTKPTSNPTRNNYQFVEWQLNGKAYNFSSKVTSNITLVALWKQEFTVTFKDGNTTLSTQKVLDGGKVAKPSNPTKGGYQFVEWRLNGTAYNFNNPVNGNITLVAEWKQEFTVTFKDGNTTLSTQKVVDGGTATKPKNNPTKEGYQFVEWRKEGSSSAYVFSTPVKSNITLVAEWKQEFTVTFKDGNTTLSTQKVVDGGTATKPSNPTKSGYTFKEWRLQGETKAYDFSTRVTSNITLVAEWTEIVDYYVTATKPQSGGSAINMQRKLTIKRNSTTMSASQIKEIKKPNGTTIWWQEDGELLVPYTEIKNICNTSSLKLKLASGEEVTTKQLSCPDDM